MRCVPTRAHAIGERLAGEPDLGEPVKPNHPGMPAPIRAKRRTKRLGRQKDVTQESEVVMHESSYPSHSMHESSYPSHTVG